MCWLSACGTGQYVLRRRSWAWVFETVMPVRIPRLVGSAYQWLAWWLQRWLIMMSWPPIGGKVKVVEFGDGGLED